MTGKLISKSLFVATMLLAPMSVYADDVKPNVKSPNALQETLEALTGKSVALKLKNGEEVSGKLAEVGPAAVHVSELKGMEFFDAVVSVSEIAAVVYRVK